MSEGKVVADGPTRSVFHNVEFLEKHDIEPPTVVKLSKKLFNHTFLTVEEFLEHVEFDGLR